jgi:hypothetical protein
MKRKPFIPMHFDGPDSATSQLPATGDGVLDDLINRLMSCTWTRDADGIERCCAAIHSHVSAAVQEEREALRQELLKLERKESFPNAAVRAGDRGWNAALGALGVWVFRRMAKLTAHNSLVSREPAEAAAPSTTSTSDTATNPHSPTPR